VISIEPMQVDLVDEGKGDAAKPPVEEKPKRKKAA
jgi:hypothetical protein